MKTRIGLVLLALAGPARAGPLAYVTDQGADAVSVVDLAQNRVVETVKVGEKPAGVAVAPGGCSCAGVAAVGGFADFAGGGGPGCRRRREWQPPASPGEAGLSRSRIRVAL